MQEKINSRFNVTVEQLDALAASFYPVMAEFFNSDRGKEIYEAYMNKRKEAEVKAA